MIYLLHTHWLPVFGALALGIVVGWLVYLRAAPRWTDRSVHIAVAVVVLAAIVAIAGAVPSRYGHWLDLGVIFVVVFAIGFFIGRALRDLAEFMPAARAGAPAATAGSYLFRDAHAGMATGAPYMRTVSDAGAPARRPLVLGDGALVRAPAPGGYTFPKALPFADATTSQAAAPAPGVRRHWSWPRPARVPPYVKQEFTGSKGGYVYPVAPESTPPAPREGRSQAGLYRHWSWRGASAAPPAGVVAPSAPTPAQAGAAPAPERPAPTSGTGTTSPIAAGSATAASRQDVAQISAAAPAPSGSAAVDRDASGSASTVAADAPAVSAPSSAFPVADRANVSEVTADKTETVASVGDESRATPAPSSPAGAASPAAAQPTALGAAPGQLGGASSPSATSITPPGPAPAPLEAPAAPVGGHPGFDAAAPATASADGRAEASSSPAAATGRSGGDGQPVASAASTGPATEGPSGVSAGSPAASPPPPAATTPAEAGLQAAPPAAPGEPATIAAVPGENKHPGRRPEGLMTARDDRADDLKRIRGIGPQNEGRLHGLGIWHFDQIAGWNPENVRWVGSYLAFPGRIDRERWVEQAVTLAGGGDPDFSKRVRAGRVATSHDDGSQGQLNVADPAARKPRRPPR